MLQGLTLRDAAIVGVGGAVVGAGVAALLLRRETSARPTRPGSKYVEDALRNLRETDVFVLDNSLRETTVASIYGHTIDGKYRILQAVREAGMKHMIIGAFGPTRRVDEYFCQSLRERGQLRDDEHYYAFSEFKDSDAPWFEAARSVTRSEADAQIPYGLTVCKDMGIGNAVIEIDVMLLWDDDRGGVDSVCKQMEDRTLWCRRELVEGASSRVFFNFRDFQRAWPKDSGRLLRIIGKLARLPAASRPTGLLYEDQNGSWLPAMMADATAQMRQAMLDGGWAEGQLLLHIHKGFGLSDASQLAAIGAGATGIWCGVSANGAMTGHASSIVTLTNLARLGNAHVRRKFNFIGLRRAAITVHKVCTNEHCPPYMTEVYGKGALDLVWAGDLMANQFSSDQAWARSSDEPFELQRLLGMPPRVRISTMAGPSMFLAKLTELFAPVVGGTPRHVECEAGNECGGERFRANEALDAHWPRLSEGQHIGHEMHALVHADLRNMMRRNYNHELGLLELYRRAYDMALRDGRISDDEHTRCKGFLPHMQTIATNATPDLDSHPLIKELATRFPVKQKGEGAQKGEGWTFERFYPEFLEPYTHDLELAHKLFDVLDTQECGEVSGAELLSACKWALREFGNIEATPEEGGVADARRPAIDSVAALMKLVVQEWLVPESLIWEVCTVPVHSGHTSELPPPTPKSGGNVHVLTANTVKDKVLTSGRNVLTCFYDPTCPHCLELLPAIEEVATRLKADASVVVAKFNVAANSVPDPFEVKTVPTLYFKSSTGFPFRYLGDRGANALEQLITSERT